MSFTKVLFASVALLLGCVSYSYAQPSHPHSPHDTVKSTDITIYYGRPYKKGRNIFGGTVAPYGQTYRCGADEPTILVFAKDVSFDGHPIKAGKYSFFAVPQKDKWTVILNSNTTMWGTDHDQHADQDVLKVDVPVQNLSSPVEQLTMTTNDKDVTLAWDVVKIDVPVKF
jgi:Protein of unknown function (DUF2911)